MWRSLNQNSKGFSFLDCQQQTPSFNSSLLYVQRSSVSHSPKKWVYAGISRKALQNVTTINNNSGNQYCSTEYKDINNIDNSADPEFVILANFPKSSGAFGGGTGGDE